MWKGRRVALVGLGKSNLAVARYLAPKGAVLAGFDQKEADRLGGVVCEARGLGMRLLLGATCLEQLSGFDTVFLTPGIKKSLPEIQMAKHAGAELSSEIGLFLDTCAAEVIGITGSAGKTTTVSLVGEMLCRDVSRAVYCGGNIGTPLIELVEQIPSNALVVLELSSFQLQVVNRSPHISAILNVSPNHLDVHDSMDEYVSAKQNIYRKASGRDWAVLNMDNDATRQMLPDARHFAKLALFSACSRPDVGSYLDEDAICFDDGEHNTYCGSMSSRQIPGRHNVQNILAAVCVSMLAGASPEHVAGAIADFRGVEHRLELVRDVRGVKYYNDSIATAPFRTMAALDTIDSPIVLIAGGYDKGVCFGELASAIVKKAKAVVLVGASRHRMRDAIEAALSAYDECTDLRIQDADRFDDAVQAAALLAEPGDAVLLSPACASFDMFTNFEERGTAYKRIVGAL